MGPTILVGQGGRTNMVRLCIAAASSHSLTAVDAPRKHELQSHPRELPEDQIRRR
jgi:hypothetical protein